MRRALLVAVIGLCDCRSPRAHPEDTVAALIEVVRAGDRAAAYDLLGPTTRQRLEALAAGARRSTGRLTLAPSDLLGTSWAPPAWEAAHLRTLANDGRSATVEVSGVGGERQELTLVRDHERWRVELAAPDTR